MPLFSNRVALFLFVCRVAFFKVSNPKRKVEISKYDEACRKIHQYQIVELNFHDETNLVFQMSVLFPINSVKLKFCLIWGIAKNNSILELKEYSRFNTFKEKSNIQTKALSFFVCGKRGGHRDSERSIPTPLPKQKKKPIPTRQHLNLKTEHEIDFIMRFGFGLSLSLSFCLVLQSFPPPFLREKSFFSLQGDNI